MMRRALFDARGQLRNGWWILLFLALFLLSRAAYTPLVRGLTSLGASDVLLQPMPFLFVLLVTWICLRLRREPLTAVGLSMDRVWWCWAVIGLAVGIASALLAAALVLAGGFTRLELDPQRSAQALTAGLYAFLWVSLFEELLFRGFLFQRLRDGAGIWPAQAAFALLFALAHWGNPEMQGITRVVATFEIALAAILLGLAYLRTGSLALPVGLHLGWNWAQGSLLGFGVSGTGRVGWWQPQLTEHPVWLSGGNFGLETTVFAIATDLLLIGLLWRWRPTSAELPLAQAPTYPSSSSQRA